MSEKPATDFPRCIVAAAVLKDGMVFSRPAPARHHDVVAWMREHGFDTLNVNQGFLTSSGEYVDRRIACLCARIADQIKTKTGPDDILFTEDMW